MQFLHGHFQHFLAVAVICGSTGLGGCGNSCFVGFSNNGSGGIIIKGGNPPPTCTLNQAQGMVRTRVAKLQECENCAPVMRVKHVYVVLRGVQIREGVKDDDSDSSDWLELAPDLNTHPRRIDLVGDSVTELLTENPQVPSDIYSLVRLQFASEGESTGSELPSEVCGATPNCVVMADGRIEPLRFLMDSPDVLLRLNTASGPLMVVPGSTSELQIRLGLEAYAPNRTRSENAAQLRLGGEFLALREQPTN